MLNIDCCFNSSMSPHLQNRWNHCAKSHQIQKCMKMEEQNLLKLVCDPILIHLGLADMEKTERLWGQEGKLILTTQGVFVCIFFLMCFLRDDQSQNNSSVWLHVRKEVGGSTKNCCYLDKLRESFILTYQFRELESENSDWKVLTRVCILSFEWYCSLVIFRSEWKIILRYQVN